ncbi:Laminin subunit gamma-1 [Dissostichus eleginoides]|uniref:Laminin subunit gamma-1 n=1 Tax=Dissostichus eleginoides TaxID=100907 RepID=A0AAD9BB47_DISEL|nr:Laminin subunit gamma-1 [Dissostichus eleginoides]
MQVCRCGGMQVCRRGGMQVCRCVGVVACRQGLRHHLRPAEVPHQPPESFAIYKRTREGGPWVPYQYYSGSCQKTYQKAGRGFIRTGEDEQQALCTDDFSDISPLTGGNVAFSTLEGRPSAYNFDNSPVLQVSGSRYSL